MLFTLIDVILIVIVVLFAALGFFMGLISAIGALIGLVVGGWLASSYAVALGEWLSPYMLNHEGTAKIIAFVLLFAIANRVIALIFWLIAKVFNLVSIIPFLKPINKFSGAILGFIEGAVVTGTIIFVIVKFMPNDSWAATSLNGSKIAHLLVWSTQLVSGLIL